MNKITQFENLSNDLFLELFDYFHALDLFMAFSSLNNRISSILSLTRLHVVITKLHCHYQIKFLSSHLTNHAHQVISVSLHDQLYNFSSVISYFFNQHTFINLQSCIFYSIYSSANFYNVIEKLKRANDLVSFRIRHPQDINLLDKIKQDLSKVILTHQSPKLREVKLLFHYNYPKLVTNIAINLTVTSLHMLFHGSLVTCSIYSLLPILRHYRALRVLSIAITNEDNSNTQQAMMPVLPVTYENNPPMSPSIKTFHLTIRTLCNFRSLNFILHCMPNLRRFIIAIVYPSLPPLWTNMFDGCKWQQLLENNTPHLEIFDIYLHIHSQNFRSNVDTILKSFDYFARKYDDWHLVIHRSRLSVNTAAQAISLRGYRHSKKGGYYDIHKLGIILGTLNVYSTAISDAQHHLIYSHIKELDIIIPINIKVFDTLPFSPLFKNIDCLTIAIDSSMVTFWEDIRDLFNIRCNIPEIDQKEHADKLASLVDLTNITKLEIQPKNDISHLHSIKQILLASPRLTQLKIGNRLIFSSILYNSSSLTPVFNRLESLYLLTKHVYFPLKYASKLIKRFPLLIHLELEIYSVDMCIPLLDILLDNLPKLTHLKIHFHKNKLLCDGTCLINHVIERRCQAFPDYIFKKDEIYVKIDGKIMNVYLSSCLICATTNFIL